MEVMKKVQAKAGSDTVQNLLDKTCPRLIDANCIKLLVSKVPFSFLRAIHGTLNLTCFSGV
jgi:hypothetical protein